MTPVYDHFPHSAKCTLFGDGSRPLRSAFCQCRRMDLTACKCGQLSPLWVGETVDLQDCRLSPRSFASFLDQFSRFVSEAMSNGSCTPSIDAVHDQRNC